MLPTAASEMGIAENLGADGADELVGKCGHKFIVVPTTCLMVSATNKIKMIKLLSSRLSYIATQGYALYCVPLYLTISSF